jgi:hypothetical protein
VKIEGYGWCSHCGDLTPDAVLAKSNGWCGLCTGSGAHPAAIKRLTVGHKTFTVPRRRSGSRGSAATVRARRNSEDAAMRRLKHIYPAVYRIILAEERAKRGLDPLPLSAPTDGDLLAELQEAVKTLEASRT